MRDYCAPARQARPLLLQHDAANANQSLAAFLVVRPPAAFLGWGWYSNDADWSELFLLQPGEPAGLCAEGPPGVFARAWSKVTVELDCATLTARVDAAGAR